jgi:hypothetical protein
MEAKTPDVWSCLGHRNMNQAVKINLYVVVVVDDDFSNLIDLLHNCKA